MLFQGIILSISSIFFLGYIENLDVLSFATYIAILCSFTDEAYKKISLLAELRFLDLCGAQVLVSESHFIWLHCPFLFCREMCLFKVLDVYQIILKFQLLSNSIDRLNTLVKIF